MSRTRRGRLICLTGCGCDRVMDGRGNMTSKQEGIGDKIDRLIGEGSFTVDDNALRRKLAEDRRKKYMNVVSVFYLGMVKPVVKNVLTPLAFAIGIVLAAIVVLYLVVIWMAFCFAGFNHTALTAPPLNAALSFLWRGLLFLSPFLISWYWMTVGRYGWRAVLLAVREARENKYGA